MTGWIAAAQRLLVPAMLALTIGCATTAPRVQRVGTGEVTDLSGRWNDTDARLSAEELVADCLSRPWLRNARESRGRQPTVIVGRVRNNTIERINTATMVQSLQRELINSQRVAFVASSTERVGVRDERADQDVHASDDSRKAFGQETAADYLLSGEIHSLVDSAGSQQAVVYQVNLKLIDIETNQIVWNGEKQIKKLLR